jgi:hypothetical protein
MPWLALPCLRPHTRTELMRPTPTPLQAPGQNHMYLVGTDEGLVHSCSKAHGSDYLATWPAHSLAMYSVRWNPLHHTAVLPTASVA